MGLREAHESRVNRIGEAVVGASHFSIMSRKETTSLLIACSFLSAPKQLRINVNTV